MDLKQFENSINKKFQDFEPEVDSLKIWDNIEADLPAKKKSRYFGLWIGLLLIPLAAFYFYTNESENPTNAISANENLTESKVEFTEVKNKNEIKDFVNPSNEAVVENILREETKNNANNKVQSEPIRSKANSIGLSAGQVGLPTFAEAKKVESKKVETSSTSTETFAEAKRTETKVSGTKSIGEPVQEADLPTFAEAKKVESNDNANRYEEKNTNDDELAYQLQFSNKQKDISVIPSETNTSEDSKEIEDEKGSAEQKVEDNKAGAFVSDDNNAIKSSTETQAKSVDETIMGNDVEDKEIVGPTNGLDADAPNESVMPKQRLSFSLLAGVLGSNRIYTDGLTQEDILTIAEKETAERQLETLQFDALLKYKVTPRLSVGLGIRNWRLSEKSTYLSERNYEGTMDFVTEIVHNPDNTIEETSSPVTVQYQEVIQNTRYQTHQAWSIPVRFYYALVSNRKLDLEIAGGYEHGITAKHKGYELDANATEYLVTLDPDDRYKNNGGNYILFNINTNYKFKNSLALTAGLEGKYGLNGFNTDTAKYQKKYHFFGLYTGLSYSF